MPNPKTEHHAALQQWVGTWKVKGTMDAMPGVPGMEEAVDSEGTETASLICDGLWLKWESVMECNGKQSTGLWLVGYDPFKKQYTSYVVSSDEHCQGLVPLTGTFDAKAKTWTWIGESPEGKMKSVCEFTGKDTLKETRKRRGGRHLQDGGACAALVLVASGGYPSHSGMFYDILAAIAAPWWRRSPQQEEACAAALTASGETPDTAGDLMSRTRIMMDAAGVPGRHIDKAVYDVALSDPDPDIYARSWTALNVAARSRKGLVRHSGYDGLAILASQVED